MTRLTPEAAVVLAKLLGLEIMFCCNQHSRNVDYVGWCRTRPSWYHAGKFVIETAIPTLDTEP